MAAIKYFHVVHAILFLMIQTEVTGAALKSHPEESAAAAMDRKLAKAVDAVRMVQMVRMVQ